MTSHLRVSASPGVTLPEPEVAVAQVVDVEGAWITVRYTSERRTLSPDAVFFEVGDASAGSAASLVNLATTLHGDLVPVHRRRWRDLQYEERHDLHVDPLDNYAAAISDYSQRLGLGEVTSADLAPTPAARGIDPVRQPQRVHVAEIAARAWRLQALTRAVAGSIPIQASGFDNSFPHMPSFLTSEDVLASSWLMLRPFSPALAVAVSGEPAIPQVETPTALEVCAVQLHNAVATQEGLRQCERCQRVFHRQRGRATNDDSHRRPDVKYCSHRCAQLSSMARYRQREKEKRQQGPGNASPQAD